MEKENNSTYYLAIFLFGMVTGCLVMMWTHSDIYNHYNTCQEKQLIETIAEMKTEKNWYIKESSNGKLKIVEMTRQELDSLTEATATEE